jgi:hypothetical protein
MLDPALLPCAAPLGNVVICLLALLASRGDSITLDEASMDLWKK